MGIAILICLHQLLHMEFSLCVARHTKQCIECNHFRNRTCLSFCTRAERDQPNDSECSELGGNEHSPVNFFKKNPDRCSECQNTQRPTSECWQSSTWDCHCLLLNAASVPLSKTLLVWDCQCSCMEEYFYVLCACMRFVHVYIVYKNLLTIFPVNAFSILGE